MNQQGSSENDGISDFLDRSEFKIVYNCCFSIDVAPTAVTLQIFHKFIHIGTYIVVYLYTCDRGRTVKTFRRADFCVQNFPDDKKVGNLKFCDKNSA